MTDAPRSFPLQWPKGRPRKADYARKYGKFRQHDSDISLAGALDRVEAEVARLGGKYLVISTNIEPRLDGRPRSGQPKPQDPGVCVYFRFKEQPYALACDTYRDVAQNLAAVAAHLDATRAIERHGVATAAETLQAFSALPPPPPGGSIVLGAIEDWWDVLGVAKTAPVEVVSAAYRTLAKKAHANGGGEAVLQRLNLARDRAIKELSA